MPTLAQMEAATPKCPRSAGFSHGEPIRCCRPCRYIAERNVWQCPTPAHGDVYAGEVLGAIANEWLDLDGLTTFIGREARQHVGL